MKVEDSEINHLRLQLENIILLLDREVPNKEMALQLARALLSRFGGIYRI